jgi:polyhydroxybutyrate depolymerase
MTGFFSFAQGVTVIDSLISGGLKRKFRIYVPAVYSPSKPAPLVLDLHGYTSNAIQQQFYSNFMPIADTAGFITAYPEGTTTFGGPFWNAGLAALPNDVQFMNDLMTYCQAKYNIDDKRIYSCGMSNGAIMSYYLACNAPNRITAIASVAGTMFNSWSTCIPNRAFPILVIHGDADATVPYSGDATFAPVDSVIKKWVKHNFCSPSPTTFTVPNINSADNSYVVNYKYSGGTNGSSVELFKIFGGSHSWPGAFSIFQNTNQDISASKEIWRFFRQYKLNQFISNVGFSEKSTQSTPGVYPNPATDFVHFENLAGAQYKIFTIYGQQVAADQSSETLDISGLLKGMYLIKLIKENTITTIKLIKE